MIRPTMILIVLLAASLSLTLFTVKYQVQDLEDDLVDLNRAVTDDRQAIHVLRAEWSHLNQPSRLRALAERYLPLGAVQSRQVGTADQLFPALFPEITLETAPGTAPLTAPGTAPEDAPGDARKGAPARLGVTPLPAAAVAPEPRR